MTNLTQYVSEGKVQNDNILNMMFEENLHELYMTVSNDNVLTVIQDYDSAVDALESRNVPCQPYFSIDAIVLLIQRLKLMGIRNWSPANSDYRIYTSYLVKQFNNINQEYGVVFRYLFSGDYLAQTNMNTLSVLFMAITKYGEIFDAKNKYSKVNFMQYCNSGVTYFNDLERFYKNNDNYVFIEKAKECFELIIDKILRDTYSTVRRKDEDDKPEERGRAVSNS